MFPFDLEDADVEVTVEEEIEPADYELDLSTGKLTGRIVTGLDAIKQRVYLTLLTDRYYFSQYPWEFGCELHELIGKGYNQDYVQAEARRMIEDALSTDDDIEGVQDFASEIDGDHITISFRILTIYGEAEVTTDV